MDLITIVLVFALVGLVTWAVTTLIPMPAAIRTLIIAVVVILLIVWILQSFGLGHVYIRHG